MKTNDILRNLAQALSLDIPALQTIFALVNIDLTEKEVGNLLKTDYEPRFEPLPDYVLILFLDALIEKYRGKKDGEMSEPVAKTVKVANNDVLKKIRIALTLHEQDIRAALALATIELTKSDLSALFRKAGHPQFKACEDDLLMDFIEGVGLLLQQRKAEAGN